MEKAIDSNADAVSKAMKNVAKQMPFATSRALNKVAYDMREYMIARMPAEMDRPTPFTLRGVRYKRSTKKRLESAVFINEIVAQYLKFQIEGGVRLPNKRAIPIPTSASKLNAYGNLPRGKIKKMFTEVYRVKNKTEFGRVSKKKGRKSFGNYKRFMSGKPKGGSRPAGLWRRESNNTRLVPIVLWEDKARYKPKQFDFYGIGKRFADRNLKRELIQSIKFALKTSR